ncbi:Hypothetical_protein [Hexamita inflata]|uniref:Hypothetical_protein n=1 Tax=Hexamita inflata TaxID=28002 RepID=A0AA86UCZ4_9EUKA|nr:Hypothetical protein HINF_LOCUS24689 [Hexamita inflata]CAI9937048.1 Hypothetical protein HINF_LOCUS24693 [Hexamita inflata]CAI9961421.1 Hypothetical protein HINF_LOCUS49066 [Hexamita inflata]
MLTRVTKERSVFKQKTTTAKINKLSTNEYHGHVKNQTTIISPSRQLPPLQKTSQTSSLYRIPRFKQPLYNQIEPSFSTYNPNYKSVRINLGSGIIPRVGRGGESVNDLVKQLII